MANQQGECHCGSCTTGTMTHLTLVGIEVIHDRRLVSVMRLALLLSSAAKLSTLCITRHPRDQLFLNLFLVCKKPPFSADCLFAQELNFRPAVDAFDLRTL